MKSFDVGLKLVSIESETTNVMIYSLKKGAVASLNVLERNLLVFGFPKPLMCHQGTLVQLQMLVRSETGWAPIEASCKVEKKSDEESDENTIKLRIHQIDQDIWDSFLDEIEETRSRAANLFRAIKGA